MTMRKPAAVAAVRQLPPLVQATLTLYASEAVLLVIGAFNSQPGMNSQEIFAVLAIAAGAFTVHVLVRGKRFTRAEALAMLVCHLIATIGLTANTDLLIGAFANGAALPIIALYAVWFLHPVWGRVVMHAGVLGWFGAVLSHQNDALTGMSLTVLFETVLAAEFFARVKVRSDTLARTDSLTGVLNHRGITECGEQQFALAVRHGHPLAMVSIDLDGLRDLNNAKGHHAGDRLLTAVTSHWSSQLRRGDAVGRMGGDEFLLVLPHTSHEEAEQLVRRLAADSPGRWSSGVAVLEDGDSLMAILARADERMYQEKSERYLRLP